ncbi:MAG: hydroxylamine reductase, partial [Geobacteraceae bacterium]|nr:hydroxylamine reductase [Geobacteraceae bacterium]
MFCHQCEQAAKGVGCDAMGVCGKKPEVAALQDNLLYGLKGLAFFADKARALGAKDPAIDRFILEGLFSTVTNVDFDPARLESVMKQCSELKEKAESLYEKAFKEKNGIAAPQFTTGPATWSPGADLVKQGEEHGI